MPVQHLQDSHKNSKDGSLYCILRDGLAAAAAAAQPADTKWSSTCTAAGTTAKTQYIVCHVLRRALALDYMLLLVLAVCISHLVQVLLLIIAHMNRHQSTA
jgi:hypothetical protein